MKTQQSFVISDLAIGYSKKGRNLSPIQSGINLTLHSGTVTSLLGLNGVGKSTLLRTICGFQKPISGDIKIYGRSIADYTPNKLAQTLSVVLTEKGNVGGLKVEELVAMGRYPYIGFWGKLGKQDEEIVLRAIESVGISHKIHCFLSDLSDGERQKVFIAKALAQESPIIILDEPTAFLDVSSRLEVMILLNRLASEEGRTIFISSHELDASMKFSQQICLLSSSLAPLVSTPDILIQNNLIEQYLKVSY